MNRRDYEVEIRIDQVDDAVENGINEAGWIDQDDDAAENGIEEAGDAVDAESIGNKKVMLT
jgi:hypothetical protein